MRVLWTIIKIFLPAFIGILIDKYLDSHVAIYAGALLTFWLTIKEYSDKYSEQERINGEFTKLTALSSFLKRRLKKHESKLHPLASAIIETKGNVTIKKSTGVSSVTDCSANEIKIHVVNQDNLILIPSVNTDAKEHVNVSTDPTGTSSVSVRWKKSSPDVIYLTVNAGDA